MPRAWNQMPEAKTATDRSGKLSRWGYAFWAAAIAGLALLHFWRLGADFPNGSPWAFDWAKYTDEGWYGNAAIRAHLLGHWYMPGDFNPAVAVPVWPFLEWLLFFVTGVTMEAARGLAVACFVANLALSCTLLRARGPRWMAWLGLTLIVTSPFLYAFTRLAILEPLQILFILAALNLAVRLNSVRRPVLVSAWIGLLFALAVLTKTTGLFLLPALVWAMLLPLWGRWKLALRATAAMLGVAAAVCSAWLALLAAAGLLADWKYYFLINDYPKPPQWYWRLVALRWSLHGLLWIDHSLAPLACAVALGAALAWRSAWGRKLWRDPLFGASLWSVAGFVLLMTLQNHPQPRYFTVPAFFCFFMVAQGAAALMEQGGLARRLGQATLVAAVAAAAVHGARTIGYATHPQYTWATAADELARYINAHPNGNRLLDSISGDEITLFTHMPSLCDDFSQPDLASKLKRYRPGWYAAWNDLDPGTLSDLHSIYSLEQVASFKALDDPERNALALFKLHPLPGGQVRDPNMQNLQAALPGDKIEIPIE